MRWSLHAETESASPLDALFAAVLRDEAPVWPHTLTSGDDVVAGAAGHGVDILIAQRLGRLTAWPPDVRARFVRAGRDACIFEAVREREISSVLSVLHGVNVDALLVKGTGLAYTVYRSPELRPRIDTDILVPFDHVERAIGALEGLGYSRTAQNSGHLVSHQLAMARHDRHGVWHVLDLHWKIANPHVFANLLTFDELSTCAVAVPALGPHARTLAPAHALLLATIHLAAHHAHQVRLIWLYDLHLICGTMTPPLFEQVVSTARSRGLVNVCGWGLRTCQQWFATPIGAAVQAALADVAVGSEEPARYLAGSTSRLATLWSDLRVLPTWGARARLLKEHAFPPSVYMLRSYRTSRRWWLPVLYIHRMVTGGWRWLRQA